MRDRHGPLRLRRAGLKTPPTERINQTTLARSIRMGRALPFNLMKYKKNQVFYSVNSCAIVGGACLSRGLFETLRVAQVEANKWAEWEIWRHEDRDGKRVENKLWFASYAKVA